MANGPSMPDDNPARARVSYSHDSAADEGFLMKLGERVRMARASRGMTRKILARDSGVSERYLAQLESGQGNIPFCCCATLRARSTSAWKPLSSTAPDCR